MIQNLETGDILHCYKDAFIANHIKAFTKSKYNHTATVLEIYGRLYVIDSQKDGTNIRPLTDWLKKYKYSFDVTKAHFNKRKKEEYSRKALSKAGVTKYDYVSLLLWQPIYIVTGKWHGKKEESAQKKMYCSEYIGWLHDVPNYWEKSPQDIFRFFEK